MPQTIGREHGPLEVSPKRQRRLRKSIAIRISRYVCDENSKCDAEFEL